MPWHTIVVEEPNAALAKKCVKNSAGQNILFDGELLVAEALERGRAASLQCYEIQIFSGKRVGRLKYTFRNGRVECTYCGKAHLDL